MSVWLQLRIICLTLLIAGTGVMVEAALPPMDPAPVQAAIEKGVTFLRNSQSPNGVWGPDANGNFAVGYTCLAGLALIECGVPKDDAKMKAAAAFVRQSLPKIDRTYEASLAILFLDRIKEKQDKRIIEYLAARLIASQTTTGGWGYTLKKLSPPEADLILNTLRRLQVPPAKATTTVWERPSRFGLCIKMTEEVRTKVVADPPKKDVSKTKFLIPAALQKYPVFATEEIIALPEPGDRGSDPDTASTDNSNVHFAILGLWSARRHEVPVERSFALLTKRFQSSQNSDGSWTYRYYKGGLNGSGRGAMTSVGLLAMAIGHALGLDRDPNDPGGRHQLERLVDGFVFLSQRVGEAVGRYDNLPTPKEKGGLYYFWVMERVAVLYDLPTLGDKDWYRWGAEILVAHQQPDGSWTEGGFHGESPIVNTSLALMFLKRANLTDDIPRRTLVNAVELSQKVSRRLPTREVAPMPHEPDDSAAVAQNPPLTPSPTTKPEPPKVATTAAKAEPAPNSPATTVKNESNGGWLYIALGVLAIGGLVAILVVMRMRQIEEEGRPAKKKAKKAKPKMKAKP